MAERADGVWLRVVRGAPDDAELAALVAVLAARARTAAAASPAARAPGDSGGGWAAYWRALGAPPAPGHDAWRRSAGPV